MAWSVPRPTESIARRTDGRIDFLTGSDTVLITHTARNGTPMAKLIHTMIRVLDLERSMDFYARGFGLVESYRLEFSEFTLVYLRNEETDAEIELTFNKQRTTPYDLGDGYGHVAFAVDDLEATHAHFRKHDLNARDIVDFAPDGTLVARFFFCADPDGYQIEVLQRSGHFQ